MPKHIEIRTPDGRAEVRRLSRRNPIVVGRNPISDVHVDDESVGPIHCRLSWNGKAFEVAAVANDGVDVNGVLVLRKELSSGDVIHVGEVDLVLLNGSSETVAPAGVAAAPEKQRSHQPEVRRREPEPPVEAPATLSDDDWASISQSEIEVEEPKTPKRRPEKAAPRRETPEPEEEPVLIDEASEAPRPEPQAKPSRPSAPPTPSRWRQTKRPGEQDILTSPLVLGFGGVSLLLLLAAMTFWLLIGREGANRLYSAAVADREAGRYAQAIRNYEQFLREYPSDDRALDARYALGLTRIEQNAGGSSPDFDRALAAFDEFVRVYRDTPEFDSQRESLRELARQIASGAAAAAVRTGDRKYLKPSEEGRRLFDRYAPTDGSVDEVRQKLSDEFASAEAAVRKREYFDDAVSKIETAIAANDFPAAFGTRTDLLTRYPDLREDRRVRSLLAKTLEAEQSLVKAAAPASGGRQPPEDRQPLESRGADAPRSPLTLVGHTQARAGEVSDGRLVFAVARDALVGLDAVTGRPRWRTPIGLDTPFFPVEVDASVPALLAFDASRNDLVLLSRDDGMTLWRTPVGSAATGPPLVAQGQIDIATADGHLMRFALDSGEPLAAVAFPQSVVGPPVLAVGGERLVVFGDQATAYTLDLRSLDVQTVSFTGQAAGAIDTPPQSLGRLVVLCENDRFDSAAVRAFAVDPETGKLSQVAAERIQGQVRQPSVARGNVLFVPSSPERITAFSVSDDAGQPPLTRLAGIQIPEAKDVPTYLVPGPDGMLWAAGSALRKLRLVADGLELQPGSLAPGHHTQPPQESGESLFVARSLPSAPAVYVSQADREEMTGSWRTVLGAAIVAVASGDAATVVTEAGQAAVVAAGNLENGGFFDLRPLPQWDEGSPEPLHGTTLSDGRAAAWRGGQTPLLWLFNAGAQPGPPRTLSGTLECSPVALDGGLALPLPGRLEWLAESGGAGQVEAFLLPVAGDGQTPPKWRFLVRLDRERLAAAGEDGTLRVIGLRREPLPHLAEVAAVKLAAPLVRPPVAVADQIAVVLDGRLQLFDPSGLRTVAEAAFDAPVTGGPWASGGLVFAQVGSGDLVALDGGSLQELWRVPLDATAAGAPVRTADGWLIASQAGTVLTLNDDGSERSREEFATPFTGLLTVGDAIAAASLDGSLYLISSASDESSTETVPETDAATDDPEPADDVKEAAE